MPFQKIGSHFYDHVMNHVLFEPKSQDKQDGTYMMKELWPFFCRDVVKNLKKDDFECSSLCFVFSVV